VCGYFVLINYENTTQVDYSNNGISNFSKRFIYVLKKPLNESETIAFMTFYKQYSIIPSNFFAFCKLKSYFNNILNEIIANENQRILNETLYNERMILRNAKKFIEKENKETIQIYYRFSKAKIQG